MRVPSIHITKDDLLDLLEEYNDRHDLGINTDDLVNYLLSKGKFHQIVTRVPKASFKKDVKIVVKGTMSAYDETALMAQIIRLLRVKENKFRAPPLVKDGGADWNKTKEVAHLANLFCDAYGFEKHIGYKRYIQIYILIKTKSFNLSMLNTRHDFICDTYEAQLRIEDDEHKDDTNLAHEKYQQIVFERTGSRMDYHDRPITYACFIDAVDAGIELGLSPENYILSQFDQLAWKSGIPKPQGFSTDMARERAITWMSENDYSTIDESSAEDNYKKMLQRARDDEDNSQ